MPDHLGQDLTNNQTPQVLRAFGQEGHVVVSSEQTGGAFCAIRFFASPGNDAPPHTHQNEDETFIIETGEVEIDRGGQVIRGQIGDVIYLPKRIPHAPRIIGSENLQAIVICVPGGFDHFFAACAAEWSKPEPNFQTITETAARFGIQFNQDRK
jgi:mannose-6-phosphate isomerase-like protein (cupin superfamily)